MNVEEAKKIAEAIAVALVKRPQGFSIDSSHRVVIPIIHTKSRHPLPRAVFFFYRRGGVGG